MQVVDVTPDSITIRLDENELWKLYTGLADLAGEIEGRPAFVASPDDARDTSQLFEAFNRACRAIAVERERAGPPFQPGERVAVLDKRVMPPDGPLPQGIVSEWHDKGDVRDYPRVVVELGDGLREAVPADSVRRLEPHEAGS